MRKMGSWPCSHENLRVSINWGAPKWAKKVENPNLKWMMNRGSPISGKLHMSQDPGTIDFLSIPRRHSWSMNVENSPINGNCHRYPSPVPHPMNNSDLEVVHRDGLVAETISSGKLLQKKCMRKLTINGGFSIVMLNYQRLSALFSLSNLTIIFFVSSNYLRISCLGL